MTPTSDGTWFFFCTLPLMRKLALKLFENFVMRFMAIV